MNLSQNFVRERDDAAQPPVELDRNTSLHQQANVLQHLARVHLDDQDRADPVHQLVKRCRGERAHGDRPQQPDLDALLARGPHRRQSHTPSRAKADDDEFGIIEEVFLVANFGGLNLLPTGQQTQIGGLFLYGIQVN